MKRKKYEFHEDLQKYKGYYIPIYKPLMPIIHSFLGGLYNLEKSNKEIIVQKKKIKSFDDKNIKFIIYTPNNVELTDECLYFIHGGGFVFNAAPHHYKLAKELCLKLQCKVIFVDYRLGPKYKFPYAPNDCFSVYKWILDNADNLKINPNKIIIAGDSAGGNLSVVTTLMAHDNKLIIPNKQLLLYPVLTLGMVTDSLAKYTDTPMCNSKDGAKYNKMYFTYNGNENRNYMAPYEAPIFEGYPPTYIEVAEYDCLHDDGFLYYKKLKENDVEVEYHEIKNAMHGYDIAIGSKLISEIIEKRIKFLKK